MRQPTSAVGTGRKRDRASALGAGRESTLRAYEQIREDILAGRLPPGSRINQVRLAQGLNISRGPLREALRMLVHEGLVLATTNRQAKVAALDVCDLEQLYGARIVLEPLCLRVTLDQQISDDDVAILHQLLDRMTVLAETGNHPEWDAAHLRFHRLLLSGAGERLVQETDRLREHAERYRQVYAAQAYAYERAGYEHAEILAAFEKGDALLATRNLARHLARTALSVAAVIDPAHDPATIRAAVMSVSGPSEGN